MIDALVCRLTTYATSLPAMGVSFIGMCYWIAAAPDWLGRTDALLSGGATLFAQMIYREAGPRDRALHKKADEIIHAIDKADDSVAGIEEKLK